MAYVQYQQTIQPSQAPQQRLANAPSDGRMQSQGQGRSNNDGQRYDDSYGQSNGYGRGRENSYEQYGGNPYDGAAAQGPYAEAESWEVNHAQESTNFQNHAYDGGYDQRSAQYDQRVPPQHRQPPPQHQQQPQGREQVNAPSQSGPYPRTNNGPPPDGWKTRQGGAPPMRGRGGPTYGPGQRGRGNFGGPQGYDRGRQPQPGSSPPRQGAGYHQGGPGPGYAPDGQGGQSWERPQHSHSRSRSRPGRGAPPGQGYGPDPAYADGLPLQQIRSQSRPRQGLPTPNRGPYPQFDQGAEGQSPPSQRERHGSGGWPINEQISPRARNFDNPFPAFPSGKNAPAARPGPNAGNELPGRTDPGRQSQDIYDDIVGEYTSNERMPRNHAGRSYDDGQQSYLQNDSNDQQNVSPPQGSGSQAYYFQDRKPGREQSFPTGPSRNDLQRPPLPPNARSQDSGWGQNNRPGPQRGPGEQFKPPSPPRPGTATGAPNNLNSRPFPSSNGQTYGSGQNGQFLNGPPIPTQGQRGRPGPQDDRSYSLTDSGRRDAGGRPPMMQNYGERNQSLNRQRSPRDQFDQPLPPPPDMRMGPRPEDRANSLPGRPFGRTQTEPPQWRQDRPPGLPRSPAQGTGLSNPGQRPIGAHMAPRSQSPFGRPIPGPASAGYEAPVPQTRGPLPNPPYAESGFGRPSMEHTASSSSFPTNNSRSPNNFPDRANTERSNYYQATGGPTQQLPKDLGRPLPHANNIRDESAQRPSNPDALPYHATPSDRPGVEQNGNASQQSSRPAPVRQYNSESEAVSRTESSSATQSKPAPVTQQDLSRLREAIRKNPSDSKAQLALAKKLAEASTVLADESGRADARTRDRNRQAFNAEAYKLVKKLVSSGYGEATFYLAECHGDGSLGLPIDAKEAFSLYQSAAKQGHAAAAYRTAVCCEIGPEEGGGTRKDLQKALQWYKRASALGDIPATYKMGIILLKGLLGQEKNVGEAVGYLKRAAQGADVENPHALHELGLLYESPKNPGIVQRDEAQAMQLFTQASKLGYKFSQFKLGQAYEYGLLGCTVDPRSSIIWYTKAAAQGEHQSELALSGWYLTGSDGILEHSDIEAYLWARKAALAEPPLPKAMFAMGYFTEVGIGCPRSVEEAKRWYGRAAAYKFPKAQQHLEELQRGGSKTQRNRETISRNQRKDADCTVM